MQPSHPFPLEIFFLALDGLDLDCMASVEQVLLVVDVDKAGILFEEFGLHLPHLINTQSQKLSLESACRHIELSVKSFDILEPSLHELTALAFDFEAEDGPD